MYEFSERSMKALASCDRRLQDVMREVAKRFNIVILEGYRDEERQEELYCKGASNLHFPHSKHNRQPSLALDFVPMCLQDGTAAIIWTDREQFTAVACYALGIAKGMGHKLRWGGDWDCDGYLQNNRFDDLGHLELLED